MKTLLDFKLWESLSKINNFKTGGITTVPTMPGTIKMFKNMLIFVPKKMFINTCVKMPIGFTNITSSTAGTCKLVHNTWFKRLGNKIFRTKHSAKFEWRSPLSKREIIICLSLINRAACFCFILFALSFQDHN